MNVNGKTLAVTTIATLVVGSLLGAWYGARRNPDRIVLAASKRPSYHIRVEIQNGSNKAVLVPGKDDTVEWWTQATSTTRSVPVTVQFLSWSPCENNQALTPISNCKITAYGLYKYKCVSVPCDPGIDPNSTTEILNFQHGSVRTSAPVPAATGPEALTVTIGCDASNNPKPDTDPLSVSTGQVISWIAGPKKFKVHVRTPNRFCKGNPSGDIDSDPNAVCTVDAPAGTAMHYTVDGVCTGNTGTFNANVTP